MSNPLDHVTHDLELKVGWVGGRWALMEGEGAGGRHIKIKCPPPTPPWQLHMDPYCEKDDTCHAMWFHFRRALRTLRAARKSESGWGGAGGRQGRPPCFPPTQPLRACPWERKGEAALLLPPEPAPPARRPPG